VAQVSAAVAVQVTESATIDEQEVQTFGVATATEVPAASQTVWITPLTEGSVSENSNGFEWGSK